MDLRKLTLLLISGLTIMAAAAVAPSLTEIAEEFSDVQNADLLSKLVLSLPAIFIAGTAPFAGRLTDQYGRLRLLVLGLILYGLGGSSGFYLDNLYLILAGRAILGLAVGILTTVTITLIGDYFSGEERKTFIGYQSTYIASVGIVFLVGAGVLADLDWRYPFLIYCLAIVLIPLAIRHLEEPKRERVELISGVHLSKPLLILFANGFALMLLFYIIPTQLPFLLTTIGYDTPSLAGIAMAINTAGMLISSLFFSRMTKRFTHPMIFVVGFVLMGGGMFLAGNTATYSMIIVSMLLVGFGIGFVWPNNNLWTLELASNQARGQVMGILTTCVFVGQFISPMAVDPVLQKLGQSGLFSFAGMAFGAMAVFFLVRHYQSVAKG